MPAGLRRYYGKGHLHFLTFSCYRRLPLLKSARARDVGQASRGSSLPAGRIRGNAGARASLGDRTAGRNAFRHAAKTEAARGAEDAQAKKQRAPWTDALAVCGAERAVARVLATAILRFQCIQQAKDDREAELQAQESSDAQAGDPSEELAVEQLEILRANGKGLGFCRRPKVRRKRTLVSVDVQR